MNNYVSIDSTKRQKHPSFAGCFYKRKDCDSETPEVWFGTAVGSTYALVSLQRGIYLTALTSLEKAFGVDGKEAFEQITSAITILPEL